MKALQYFIVVAGVCVVSLALAVAFLLFLPLALLLLGAGLAGWATREIWKGRASRTWPHTEGVILSSSTEQQSTQLVSGVSRAPLASRLKYHASKVSYSYTINGLKRVGHRPFYCARGSDARFDSLGFATDKTVPVYYNPHNPGESVLVPGGPLFPHILVVAFGLFIALAGLVIGAGFLQDWS